MAEKNKKKRIPRQSWEPSGWLKLLRGLLVLIVSAVKIAAGAVATVFCIVVVCGLVFVGLLGSYLETDIIPNADETLENYDEDLTSFVYAVNSEGQIEMIQKIYTSTDRQWVSISDIPENLIHAAVAIEDKRFYEHQGVDWITTVKACANMFFGGSTQFGGSTITQQLIKNLTEEDSVTVQRKVMEIFKAQQFERKYDKDVILEWYFNKIYLGENCYGVKSAAETYFGKELQDLTIAECASLIGITKNPYQYDPYRESSGEGNPSGQERNRERQLDVLEKMLEQGWITEEEYEEAVNQPMVFKSGIEKEDQIVTCPNGNCGYTGTVESLNYDSENDVYRCPECGAEISGIEKESSEVYSYFVETAILDVAKDLAARDGVEWNTTTQKTYLELIKRGGYHIYTTLDMEVQAQVDKIYTDLSQIPATRGSNQLQSAIVVIDNRTGDIVALSGGVGEKTGFFETNRINSTLQTGSCFKPLTVYAPAFEVGAITPATVIKDLPLNYKSDGTPFPRNDSRTYDLSRTVLSGVVSSVNSIAVNTLESIGLSYSFNFAKDKFGISTLTEQYVNSRGTVFSDVDYSPLALGALTFGATVRDVTNAYATFANSGYYREARTYTKVYNTKGEIVLDNTQEGAQIISEKAAAYMSYCLVNAVNSGTGTSGKLTNMTVAAKTGTTTSSKDRWYCGYTGYYTAAVWCGYDYPETISLVGDTSNPAGRLWKKVMAPLHEGKEDIALYDESQMIEVTVCLDSGKLATDACMLDTRGVSRTATALVYDEDIPSEVCDKHVLVDYCVTGGGVANEYCQKFAEVGSAQITKRSLVKMTQEEISEIKQAGEFGLNSVHLQDGYIYLVDELGNDMNFRGIYGTANAGVNAPYVVCTAHTEAAWNAYCAQHPEVIEPEEPEEPTDPVFPGFDWPW